MGLSSPLNSGGQNSVVKTLGMVASSKHLAGGLSEAEDLEPRLRFRQAQAVVDGQFRASGLLLCLVLLHGKRITTRRNVPRWHMARPLFRPQRSSIARTSSQIVFTSSYKET